MKRISIRGIILVMVALAITLPTTSNLFGKRKRKAPAPKIELNAEGKKLEAEYSEMLKTLKTELLKEIPSVDQVKKAAYNKAIEAEKAAKKALEAAQKEMGKIKKGHGLVAHAKGKWIGGAKKGIAATKEKLKKAKSDEERKKLQEELAKWEKNKKAGEDALKERQAFLDAALKEEPTLKKNLETAQKGLEKAKENSMEAFKSLGLGPFLASDKLDAKLAKFMVISQATPRGLAEFAQKGAKNKGLIDELLSNEDLMIQMELADGAKGGKYGQAMKIYKDIQLSVPKVLKGTLQRLALAIALEHATPVSQRNPKAKTDAPSNIDPVKRYKQYEKAFLNKELDPAFKDFDVWEMRYVVYGKEPDETLEWGREMLRNYRPDHITTDDYKWRYVAAVRTDIRYGSQYNRLDKPELQFFQNILANGGVCGRRAFFGRFMLRAFGIPTTARPQRGHAALAHWTPKGWVVNLGGGWGIGWTKTRYDRGLDFLANTQAREVPEQFKEVKRAQWIGSVVGEKPVYGFLGKSQPEFWYGVSLFRQRGIVEDSKAETLEAVGTELGEANESNVKYAISDVDLTEKDKKISVDKEGAINIPAAATSKPTQSTRKIIFMQSVLGGKQLHYNRTGKPEDFEYTFDAPKAGKYKLKAKVVTPTPDQLLLVSANGEDKIEINLPYTVGMWEETDPVELTLKKGENVLKFSRGGENIRGLTIKEFTLIPTN